MELQNNIKISTIVPILNVTKYLSDLIKSYLKQRHQNWEIIFIDDESEDDPKKLIENYNDSRLRYFKIPPTNLFTKFNYGLRAVTGDVFNFMGGDDALTSGCFEIVLREMQDNVWIYGDMLRVDDEGKENGIHINKDYDLSFYREINCISSCTCFINSNFIRQHNLEFNNEFQVLGDYHFLIQLAHLARPKQIHDLLIKYRVREDMTTIVDDDKRPEALKKTKEMIKTLKPQYSKEKKKVLITVCNEGKMRVELSNVLTTMTHDRRHDIKIIYPNLRPYENNLNTAVKEKFLSNDYDYMLIIDNDNPPINNPLDLVELDKDIIGLPTPQWNESDKNFPIYFVAMERVPEGYKEFKNKKGLQEVDAVGSGCVLIARRVLEKVKAPFLREWDEDGRMNYGGDFTFCKKAKEQGFKIYTHYDYPCSHFKELNLLDILKYFG